ncbi:hypothetical protein FACS189472_11870 [Alphaproteobacteria bacterium]|nr:hypothetical protein FACS189472_11870 [Alphaproteobacteria bacterium]
MEKIAMVALCAFKFASSDAMIVDPAYDNGLAGIGSHVIIKLAKAIGDSPAFAAAEANAIAAHTRANNEAAAFAAEAAIHAAADAAADVAHAAVHPEFPRPPSVWVLLYDAEEYADMAVTAGNAARDIARDAADKIRLLLGTCQETWHLRNHPVFRDDRADIARRLTALE